MNVARLIQGAVLVAACALPLAPARSASAQPCPDVEVVFARGTSEAPGVGSVGQAFVSALRAQAGDRSVGMYPVNYAASADFDDHLQFARTFVDGVRDVGAHIGSVAATCPDTRIVLGGYSQGAAVAGMATTAASDAAPAAYRDGLPGPIPPEVADHITAVVLLGRPSDQAMRNVGAPPVGIGPQYADKTIDLCAPGDTVCGGGPIGIPFLGHAMYGVNGMTKQAAAFAVGRL